MSYEEAIKRIESSDVFKSWRKKHPGPYLSSVYTIMEGSDEPVWQLGYFDKDTDKMTTFVDNKMIEIVPAEKVLKTTEEVKEISLKDVKKNLEEVLVISKSFYEKNFPSEKIIRTLIILQFLKQGQLWNITFFTPSFHTINIRIDAAKGTVLEHSRDVLFSSGV